MLMMTQHIIVMCYYKFYESRKDFNTWRCCYKESASYFQIVQIRYH